MKAFKISFLTFVAIAVMSFTIISQAGILKNPPADISGCYESITNLQFLVSCNSTTWSTVQANCANEFFIENYYPHKDLVFSNFHAGTKNYVAERGEVDELTGQVGSGTKFIKVQQIECHSIG